MSPVPSLPPDAATRHRRPLPIHLGCVALLFGALTLPLAPRAEAATPALVWSALSPPTSPPPLRFASAAYDTDNQTLVVFGGTARDGTVSGATWVWNGTTWTQASSAVASPPPRTLASLAFDPYRHQMVLFGGEGSDGQFLNDTWAWNGQSWTQLTPPSSPAPRDGAAIGADPAGNLVLFGGTGASAASGSSALTTATAADAGGGAATVLGDTWTWDGTTWQASPATGPPARTDAALSFDSAHQQSVLFGGATAPAGSPGSQLADTWIWTGTAWTSTAPAAAPPPRQDAVFGDVPAAGGPVLFGGFDGGTPQSDTWAWDGGSWNRVASPSTPDARQGAAAGADTSHGRLVMFGGAGAGGTTLGDTEVLGSQPVTATPTPQGPASTRPGSGAHLPSTSVPRTPRTPGSTSGQGPSAGAPPATPITAPALSTPISPLQTVRPGALVTLLGGGFASHTPVTITFHSTPATVGRTMANGTGEFAATVAVPERASQGEHRFVASGMGQNGRTIQLVTAVLVVGSAQATGHHHNRWQTPVMVAISILIPVGTYVILTVRSRRRRPAAARK